jgi:iron complex outermembrane recepter protein
MEEREMRRFNRMMTAALCSTMLVPAAYAQEAQSDEDSGDEPIIVTATLRDADVQDIPIAVTAVAPAALERQGVSDIKTLSSISPSFNIQSSQTESQGTSIRIRGVGTTGNNIGLESSVGVFIDGVYQSRPGVALGDLVDLERLEILRGPQGTLFGRNTSAGALNVTTKRPNLSEVEGFVNASYGNYDFFNVQGGVSIPVAKDLAGIRISGTYRKRDGWIKSVGGFESNTRDRYMVRGQLFVEPSPDISIRILADYSKADELCCDAINVRETEIAALGAYQAYGLPNDGVSATGKSAVDSFTSNSGGFRNSQRQWGISGELIWDFGGAKLTYIGAYRDFLAKSDQNDFTTLLTYSVGKGDTAAPTATSTFDDIRTMTQELRLQGTAFNDSVDWLIGAYYSDEKIDENATLTLGSQYQASASTLFFPALAGLGNPFLLGTNPLLTATAIGNAGAPVSAAGSFANNLYTQDSKSYSLFTHNVINFTDSLSLTLGARYVDEKKEGAFDQLSGSSPACQAIVNGIATGRFTAAGLGAFAPNLLGATCFPFAAATNMVIPTGGVGPFATAAGANASLFLPLPREFSNTFKDNALTYTAQLGYKINPDILVYAGLSRGFKSGGFNLDSTAAAGGADPRFRSEKVDAYEGGIKATFGRIKANLAVFHMDLKDFQVLEFTGIQFVTFNIDKAKSTGAELEIFGRLHDYISANLSMTYVNSRYPNDCASTTLPADSSERRLCGSTLTNAPKFAGVFGMTYDGPLNSSGWGLIGNFNVNYQSSRRTSTLPFDDLNATAGLYTPAPVPLDIQEASMKINARLGFRTPDERFTFELWGTNLSNEKTRTITFNTPLRGGAGARDRSAFYDEPRMYGLTVRAKF